MAANLDKNFWYQVTMKSGDVLSLASTSYGKSGAGSAFFQITNKTSPHQLWQIYSAKEGMYVLRSQQSGPTGYLTTHVGKEDTKGENTGNTVPGISVYTQADKSMYWTIAPWGDGSSYMINAANGTNWHLEKETSGLMTMSSNKTAPQPGQSFVFQPLMKIDDKNYSTLQVATASSTATPTGKLPTSSATPTLGASQTTTPETSSGLSTGAKAGIGAGVGIVALLAIVAGIFLLMRRRKQKYTRTPPFDESEMTDHNVKDYNTNGTHGDYAELPTGSPPGPLPAELDGGHYQEVKPENKPNLEPVQLP